MPAGFDKVLAIGKVEGFKFTKGRFVSKAAVGKDLFKCLDWNFSAQSCFGRWQKVADLKKGESYTVNFDPQDPGYAEKSNKVNLLDKNKNLLDYTEEVKTTAGNIETVVVSPAATTQNSIPATIKNVEVKNLDTTSLNNDLIVYSIPDPIAQNVLVVENNQLQAESIKIEQQAAGPASLRCIEFGNFSSTCVRWVRATSLALNEIYTVSVSSPGKSAFGQAQDGVLVLDQNYEVINAIPKPQNADKNIAVELINMNPYKITSYYDSVVTNSEFRINVQASTATSTGKTFSLDPYSMSASRSDIEGRAEGNDLFKCTNFDFATQTCQGKWKKNQDIKNGEIYQFYINKTTSTQGFFESKKNVSLLTKGDELLEYDETVLTSDANKMTLEILPKVGAIKKIKVNNYLKSGSNDLKISFLGPISAKEITGTALEGYAINPTSLTASSSVIEADAKGNLLFKCKDWDFEKSLCLGKWEKYKNLNPGERYSVTIDDKDPGFMEVTGAPPPPPPPPPPPASLSWDVGDPTFQKTLPYQEKSLAKNTATADQNLNSTGQPSSPAVSSGGNSQKIADSRVLPSEVSQEPKSCSLYLLKYIKFGENNDPREVRKLQRFLNKLGYNLPITGYYGEKTLSAVIKFQEANAKEILTPWNISKGTGRIYKTTKSKINAMVCENQIDL